MTKHALLIIDIQNDYFADGKWPLHNMEYSAENATKILQHARNKGDLVIHVHHEADNAKAPFFVPNTKGAEIHPSVAPQSGEPTVLKHQINAFLQTNLKELLDQHQIQQLTIIGSMSHMCIDAAVRAASDYGFVVTVVEDACATRGLVFGDKTIPAENVHAAYMSALGFAYAQIKSTTQYLT